VRTKDKLLELLNSARGTYISGEEIAARLSVSRGAIWKAVKALRAEGCEIHAVTRKGYCLIETADMLTPYAVKQHLNPQTAHLDVEVCSRVASTSQTARERMAKGDTGEFLIVAAEQTDGRGRRGRAFFSPADTGLYMSLLFRPDTAITSATLLTAAAAVAVAEVLEQFSGKETQIKWVNDIFQQGKKVAGILTEAGMSVESAKVEYVILGIGINLFSPKEGFPAELSQAGAVFHDQTEKRISRGKLAAEIINRLFALCEQLEERAFLAAYRKRSLITGKTVTVQEGEQERRAQALEIDDACRLKVRYENGEEALLFGGEILYP